MATTINASASSGLITTADTSTILQLQTNGTAAVTIGTDQSVNFAATGQRITGDFSNATIANRVMFQTSTTNSATDVGIAPNGSGASSTIAVYSSSDMNNSSRGSFNSVSGTDIRIASAITGTGTYLPMTFYTGGSERVRIDTSGNVGIGTSSPVSKLDVQTGTGDDSANSTLTIRSSGNQRLDFYNNWSTATGVRARIESDADSISQLYGTLKFYTTQNSTVGVTERMRIDSSGNLLLGKTAIADTVVGFQVEKTGRVLTVRAASTSADNTYIVYSTGASAYRFYVGLNGTVNATNTTISAISDQRLKENVQDLDVGLDKIMALKPRKFDWKEGKGKNIKGDRGWIAQEFEQVFPDMIDEWLDPSPEGEDPYKSVRADLIPVLVKAIQEQQAIIQTLTDRITALEGTTP